MDEKLSLGLMSAGHWVDGCGGQETDAAGDRGAGFVSTGVWEAPGVGETSQGCELSGEREGPGQKAGNQCL